MKIGDKIEAQQFDGLTEELYGDVYEIEIVGIFRIHFKQKISEFTCEDYILENMIFTDMEMNHWWQVVYSTHYGNDVRAREKDRNYGHLMLYVEDPEMQDSVREELLKIDSVDWEYYKITVYDHDYKVAAKPLRMILSFTNTMIIVMAVGSLVILSLILTMWVKSRKREIGILSSIGVNKRTILKQLLLESCLVAIVAFVLAGVFAKTVTDGIGTGIVNIINITSNSGAYEVISSPGSSEYAINKLPGKQEVLDYAVTPEILVVVFGVMLLVVVSSVLFSSLRIIRQKPREMLGR